MKLVERKLSTLKPDPKNVRRHGEKNLETIKQSLARFGQRRPILIDKAGVVIAGNGTLEAARLLGLKTLWAIVSDLPADKAREYAITDNRSAELATWEFDDLVAQLKDAPLDALDAMGFERGELEALQQDWVAPRALNPDAIEPYDAGAEEVLIKVTGVPRKDAERVVKLLEKALNGTGYKVAAY